MSSWVNLDKAAEAIGNIFVFSFKPSPTIFAEETWDIEKIKKDLKANLKKIKDCAVEVIMKDISTLRYEPQRLWEWAKIAVEAAAEIE